MSAADEYKCKHILCEQATAAQTSCSRRFNFQCADKLCKSASTVRPVFASAEGPLRCPRAILERQWMMQCLWNYITTMYFELHP